MTIVRDVLEWLRTPRGRRVLSAAVIVVPIVVGLWLVRDVVLSGGLPEGDDMPYHVAKNRFAVDDIFGRARLDGWSPLFNLGAEQFLLYGPGAALIAMLFEVASFGMLRAETIVGLEASLAFVATAPAAYLLARSLRIGKAGAAAVAIVSLCVSVPFGPGLSGTFDLGLMPHQVATPFVLLALAGAVRLVDEPRLEWVLLTSASAVMVCVTHLTSALVGAIAGAALLACSLPLRRPSRRAWGMLGLTGISALALGAWWFVPLVETSGPRPPVATWATPPFWTRVRGLIRGEDWAHPSVAALVTISVVVALLAAAIPTATARRLGPWRYSVVAAGPLALLGIYFVHWRVSGGVGQLVSVRGLGLVLLVTVLSVGVAVDHLAALVPRVRAGVEPDAVAAGVAVALGAMLVVAPFLVPASGLVRPAPRPSPALERVAVVLGEVVPTYARFAWVHEQGFDTRFGPVHPELWLVNATGRNALNGFGGETVSPVDTFLQYRLATGSVAADDDELVTAGVTHLVASPDTAARYVEHGTWRPLLDEGGLVVLERTGGTALARVESGTAEVRLRSWGNEAMSWSVSEEGRILTSLPAFPKWHVEVDGAPARTYTVDGYLGVEVDGPAVVTATFRRSPGNVVGLVITVVAIVAWVVAWRRRQPGEPSDGAGASEAGWVDGASADAEASWDAAAVEPRAPRDRRLDDAVPRPRSDATT